jgi:protein TonB
VITPRLRRCPLRQPRIWLWAAVVALPAHIGLAYALSWQSLGELVACPVSTPLRVRLHEAAALPTAPVVAQAPYANAPAKPWVAAEVATAHGLPKPNAMKAPEPSSELARLEPARGPAPAASPHTAAVSLPGIVGVAALGFLAPPPPPPYPAASRARGEEGTAMLLALVSQTGIPDELKLERSSGFSRLDHAALAAAATWQFNGPGAPTWVRVPVRFALTN